MLNIKTMEIEIKLSIEEYFDRIRPCLKDILNDIKKSYSSSL